MLNNNDCKCPCCGESLSFDTKALRIKCKNCKNEFDVGTLNDYTENLFSSNVGDMMEWHCSQSGRKVKDTMKFRVYHCDACGTDFIGSKNKKDMICQLCSGKSAMKSEISELLSPDIIIPFKLEKKAAADKIRGRLKRKCVFITAEKALELMQDIYVPVRVFNADAYVDAMFKGSKVNSQSDGNTDYAESSYYSVIRSGRIPFRNITVSAATGVPKSIADALISCDASEAVEFKASDLKDIPSLYPDADEKINIEQADEYIRNTAENITADSVSGYSSFEKESSSVRLSDASVLYALVPVWLMNIRCGGKKYHAAVNAQTGKYADELPTDLTSVWIRFFILAILTGACVFGLITLLGLI